MLAFLATFLQPILNFLGGPVVKAVVDSYKLKLEAETNTEKIAADLAGRELILQQRAYELDNEYKISILGRWYEPINILGYIIVFYIAKVMVWDAALHWGSTDVVKGDVATWAGMYMIFLVGKRGFENVANILIRFFRK